jgi:two-component system, LuxR family, response regulator FixJ
MACIVSTLVLIAADDEAVRDSLQFSLRLEGYRVRTHSDKAGLLNDPTLAKATCVVLDDRKPHLDGFDLLTRLRARGLTMPAVLLSNNATQWLRARAVAAGFRAVLEKPLLNNILAETLRTILATLP